MLSGLHALIDNPEIEIDDLIRIIPAPDFPTGGIIMGRSAVKHAYKTGRGGVVVRGKAEIEETNSGRSRIIITELPYQVNKAQLIVQIAELVKNKRLDGISDIKEESDRKGMRIVIDIKKDFNAQVVLNSLYKMTQLQKSSGIIFLALANNQPRLLNLKEMLSYYLDHQREVLVRKTEFDLAKAKEREHILKGLVIALANIDEVISIIKSSADKQEASIRLTEKFELDELQANAILEMKLSRLTSLEVEKLNEELAEIERQIADLQDILDRPERVMQILRDNFEEIKQQYGDARKTEISLDAGGIDIADLIDKEDVVISMTNQGYIKRMSTSEYKAQNRGGVGVTAHKTKEEDFVKIMFVTSTHDDLLFFTNFGRVYCIKAYEVPEAQRTAKGRAIVNLLMLSEGEKVSAIIPRVENATGNLIMATRQGLIKKTELKEFESIRKVGKIALHLVDGDELIGVEVSSGNDDILVASSDGKAIRFNEGDVRNMGRNSQGVRSMRLNNDEHIVDMTVVKPGTQIVTVSEKGYGKRSDVDEYRLQSRGGKGIKAGVFNSKTGKLVALKQSIADDDIMLIADNGVIIRTPISQISSLSRVSQGVRLMRLKDDNKIVGVALVKKEDEQANSDDEQSVIANHLTNDDNNSIIESQSEAAQPETEE